MSIIPSTPSIIPRMPSKAIVLAGGRLRGGAEVYFEDGSQPCCALFETLETRLMRTGKDAYKPGVTKTLEPKHLDRTCAQGSHQNPHVVRQQAV